MAAIPYTRPALVGIPGSESPIPRAYALAVNAAFAAFDFVKVVATGTIGNIASQGSMAALAGPAGASVTIVNHSSSGAPARTFYIVTTYTASSNESLPGQMYVQNCPAGTVPGITVASAGAPADATNFAAYVGILPDSLSLQQATKTTTALGSEFDCANPLTNSIGINRCATNDSASIAGLALHDSAALYFAGIGGSAAAGGPASLFGASMPTPGLVTSDTNKALVASLLASAPIAISLKQAWNGALAGTTAGITLDTAQDASGIFIADTSQSNKILTITGLASVEARTFDTGARVYAFFNSGVI